VLFLIDAVDGSYRLHGDICQSMLSATNTHHGTNTLLYIFWETIIYDCKFLTIKLLRDSSVLTLYF